MSTITASVGRGGVNRAGDVRTIQELLNQNRKPPLSLIPVNGIAGPEMITAIADFQFRNLKMLHPDARVDPGGRTLHALSLGTGFAQLASGTPPKNLSGQAWWHANQAKYPNSNHLEDLEASFRQKATEFIAAMQAAGAIVSVKATRRSKQRAYLMHFSWKIAKGTIGPAQVPPEPGVDIIWDHGNSTASKMGAQEMVDHFGLVFQPSLNSLHIQGKAIDMDVTWSGTLQITNKSGVVVPIGAPHLGSSNTTLHSVGATYGVIKLASDPPHWSATGN